MAATFATRTGIIASQIKASVTSGSAYEDVIEVTGDSSYPAGGYAFGIAQIQALYGGLGTVLISVDVVNPWVSATPTSYMAVWNKATGKIMAQAQGTAGAAIAQVDVTATTNLSTFTCTIRVRFN